MRVIDVSSNNPHPIDWVAVRRAQVDAVMIKATEGAPGTKSEYTNPFFGEDYWNAGAVGLKVGAYHFWHPEQDLFAQLSFFREHYAPRAGDLAPWWDAEINPTARPWSQLASDIKGALWCLAAAYPPAGGLVYLNRSWAAALAPFGIGPDVEVIAEGVAVTPARVMQFAPLSIPGIGGLTDWSVMP